MRKKSAVGGEVPVEKGQASVKIKWEVGRCTLTTIEEVVVQCTLTTKESEGGLMFVDKDGYYG